MTYVEDSEVRARHGLVTRCTRLSYCTDRRNPSGGDLSEARPAAAWHTQAAPAALSTRKTAGSLTEAA